MAVNKEVYTDEVLSELGLSREKLIEQKAIEVGNIFKLGTRFSEALGLFFKNENGESTPVIMCSYGIGPSRVMGVIAETLSDEKGLVWPRSVAPFDAYLISLSGKDTEVVAYADKIYAELTRNGVSVLYDNREISAGVKFSDAELLGIPTRVVVSESLVKKGVVEITDRASGKTEETNTNGLIKKITEHAKRN